MGIDSEEDLRYHKVQQNRLDLTLMELETQRSYTEHQLTRQKRIVKQDLSAMKIQPHPPPGAKKRQVTTKRQQTQAKKAQYTLSNNMIVKGQLHKRVPLRHEDQNRLVEANQTSMEILREKFTNDKHNIAGRRQSAADRVSRNDQVNMTAVTELEGVIGTMCATLTPGYHGMTTGRTPSYSSGTPKSSMPKISGTAQGNFFSFDVPLGPSDEQKQPLKGDFRLPNIRKTSLSKDPIKGSPQRLQKSRRPSATPMITAVTPSSSRATVPHQPQPAPSRSGDPFVRPGFSSPNGGLPQLDHVLIEKQRELERERETWKDVKQCRYLRNYDPPNMVIPGDANEFVFGVRSFLHRPSTTEGQTLPPNAPGSSAHSSLKTPVHNR